MKKASSLLGLVSGILILIIAFIMDGGHVSALFQVTAFMIVVGGTMAAVVISTPTRVVSNSIKLFKIAMFDKQENPLGIIDKLVAFAESSKREGVLSLEGEINKQEDRYIKQGLTLLVDGTDEDTIRDVLELELMYMHKRHMQGSKMFERAGMYAPALGITGTVMGLVHILANLNEPATLGGQIAVAFIATLYGVFTANVMWLPIAEKLKEQSREEITNCEMIIEAIASMSAGQNSKVIRQKLLSFLPPDERK